MNQIDSGKSSVVFGKPCFPIPHVNGQALTKEKSFSDPMPGVGLAIRPMPITIDTPPYS